MTETQPPNATVQLVLLPGMDGTGLLFAPFTGALPASVEARVVSYPPDRIWTLGEYADHVVRCLPGGPCVLVAESFSGLVALALLARRDPRIRGVVFCAAFAEPPRPFLAHLSPLVGWIAAFASATPSFIFRHLCVGADAPPELVAPLRQAMAATDPRVLAHRFELIGARREFAVQCADLPCAYLLATGDRLVPASSAGWFAARFSRFSLERIEGPHFLLQARSAECAGIVARLARAMLRPDAVRAEP